MRELTSLADSIVFWYEYNREKELPFKAALFIDDKYKVRTYADYVADEVAHKLRIRTTVREVKASQLCDGRELNVSLFDALAIETKLTLYKRFSDYEVLGELFREYQQQFLELTFIERLLPLLAHLIAVILNICSTSWDEFMENLMADAKAQEQFLPFLKIINTSKS